jgi:membrane protease YdiL (CAAX protease family)
MTVVLSTPTRRAAFWSVWVVAALCMLPLFGGAIFAVIVAGTALLLAAVPGALPHVETQRDRRDLLVIGVMYLVVVGLMRVAFGVFTTGNIPGLFLSFAAALLVGAAGPIIYTVWFRQGSLRDLGIRVDNWRPTVGLALLFGGVQFALTFWGYRLPTNPEDWVPLLVMALVVGVFESVFFRGFIQNRLESQFGPVVGIAGAAVLYGLYHIGYGMGVTELAFLTGLGVIYAVGFALVRNLLVLWPLLTPLGSFYAQVSTGDIDLPWASILGFADVLVVVIVVLLIARRHERRRATRAASATV